MIEINNCRECGSPAEIDYDCVIESYKDWQNGYVQCKNSECGIDISSCFIAHKQPKDFELTLITAWNAMNPPLTP